MIVTVLGLFTTVYDLFFMSSANDTMSFQKVWKTKWWLIWLIDRQPREHPWDGILCYAGKIFYIAYSCKLLIYPNSPFW